MDLNNSSENINLDSSIDKNGDPLFISNSDNPNSALVSSVFNGGNFIRWKRSVIRALGAKNKVGFINGVLLEPAISDKDYLRWKRADYMVTQWILCSMSTELADDFSYVESSIELWKELCERFGQSNGPMIYQLRKELDSLKQENLTILSYYGKVKKLWDELQSLTRLPVCTCGAMSACTCFFLKKIAQFEADEQMMQFLLGLNPAYDNVVSNVLSMDPLPSINKAFSITQQVEKQKEVCNVSDVTESAAMAVKEIESP